MQSTATDPVETVEAAASVATVLPKDVKLLPAHIQEELSELRTAADAAGSVTSHNLRPVVASAAIWLSREKGVLNEQDHPGVIDKVSSLMHQVLPVEMIGTSEKNPVATSFAERINYWLSNNLRRQTSKLQIEIAHDSPPSPELPPALRQLRERNPSRLKRMPEGEEPTQGHSAKSILGKGRSFKVSFCKYSQAK